MKIHNGAELIARSRALSVILQTFIAVIQKKIVRVLAASGVLPPAQRMAGALTIARSALATTSGTVTRNRTALAQVASGASQEAQTIVLTIALSVQRKRPGSARTKTHALTAEPSGAALIARSPARFAQAVLLGTVTTSRRARQ